VLTNVTERTKRKSCIYYTMHTVYGWLVKRLQSRSDHFRVKILFTPRAYNKKPDRKNTSALFTPCIFCKWTFSLKQDTLSGCSGTLVWVCGRVGKWELVVGEGLRENEYTSHANTRSGGGVVTVPFRVIFQMENTSVSGNKNQIDVHSYCDTERFSRLMQTMRRAR